SREFLLVRLASADNGNGQHLLAEVRIYIQHLLRSLFGFLRGSVRRMAFLPQELSGTQERTRGLFPAHYGTPLIVHLRQIPVRLELLRIKLTEQGLGGRTYAQALLQLFHSAMGYPGHLPRKAFYMILFLLKQALRNEHGQVHILYT